MNFTIDILLSPFIIMVFFVLTVSAVMGLVFAFVRFEEEEKIESLPKWVQWLLRFGCLYWALLVFSVVFWSIVH